VMHHIASDEQILMAAKGLLFTYAFKMLKNVMEEFEILDFYSIEPCLKLIVLGLLYSQAKFCE